MKRTPIIVAGQVYLHTELDEYVVVIKAKCGEIQYKAEKFCGQNDVELFLTRFEPVDPINLKQEEHELLLKLLDKPSVPLSIGWVQPEDEDGEYEDEDGDE